MAEKTQLHQKLKPELIGIAKKTGLQTKNFEDLKKADLVTALDGHLRANASRWSNDSELKSSLENYWKTVSKETQSPIKKAIDTVTSAVTSEEEKPKKQASRRKTTGDAIASTSNDVATTIATPAREIQRRSSSMLKQASAPTSPAQLAAVWEKGTKRVTDTVSKAYNQTSMNDYMNLARDNLSSPAAINILAWLLEAYSLGSSIMPYKKIGEIPAIPALYKNRQEVSGPDFFVVLEAAKFWAPITLWLFTSTILPALVAYFINIPMKVNPGSSMTTRSSSSSGSGSRSTTASPLVRDWFMFNIAKGLICYLVYADHKQMFNMYSNFTIATVNESIYGGYSGMLTAAGIGAAASLYEAVLKK